MRNKSRVTRHASRVTTQAWVVLILIVSVLLTACDNNAPAPASPTPQPEATAVPTEGARVRKLNPEVSGTIDMWHFWGSPVRHNALRRVIAVCSREMPNLKVRDIVKPFPGLWAENAEAVKAGAGIPDVIVEDRPKLGQAAANNIETNLQEWATRDGIDGSAFWPFTWKQTLYNGDTYGIPFETDVRVLFWNKNAFREAGLDPDKPPRTWAELEAYADKLDKKASDGTYERIGFMPLIKVGWEVWGYANDVDWITEDGEPAVNTPRAVETLDWIKKWVDRYGGSEALKEFRSNFSAPPQDEFMSGRVAMVADINGFASQLNFFRPRVNNAAGELENLDWGVSDLPYNTDKSSWSGGFALSIPRGAKNPELAWEFIKCATSAEAQASWARDTYAMPANIEAANDPLLLADPTWQFVVDAMSYSTGGNDLKEYPTWSVEINNRLEDIWTGKLDTKAALDQAQQAIEEEVAKKK